MEVFTQPPAPVKRTCDDCRQEKPSHDFLFLLIGKGGEGGTITICLNCAAKTIDALIRQIQATPPSGAMCTNGPEPPAAMKGSPWPER